MVVCLQRLSYPQKMGTATTDNNIDILTVSHNKYFIKRITLKKILNISLIAIIIAATCLSFPSRGASSQTRLRSDILRTGWTVVYVDSEELTAENGAASNAIDGNPSTYWITQWLGSSPGHPHEIQIDLGQLYLIDSFKYLPRQDSKSDGTTGEYEIYVSADRNNWGSPVAAGTFASNKLEKTVNFIKRGRFVRFRSLTEINNQPWTSAAEINLTGQPIASGSEFQITIDHTAHQTFGLYYPVTYIFQIPNGLNELKAQFRYDNAASWQTLSEKSTSDSFNGIDAIRFDYPNHRAYFSLRFSNATDDIFIRMLNGTTEVPLSYVGIPLYYDNRTAAVTVSLDDWNAPTLVMDTANQVLIDAQIHYTGSIVTGSKSTSDWANIQGWYDLGYLEPGSHSRDHPCYENEYLEQGGYTYQIAGSRDDILNNLVLRHEYVPAFILPCGGEWPQVRQAMVDAHYIVDRGASPFQDTFSDWQSDGAYQMMLYSYSTQVWQVPVTPEMRDAANATFDDAYKSHKIYNLMDNPAQGFWDVNSYLRQHIDHIKNHPDVWYASLGELYLYHFVQGRGLVDAIPFAPDVEGLATFTGELNENMVSLHWTTTSESGLTGFNLYRSEIKTNTFTQLNSSLISAQYFPSGGSYHFSDTVTSGRSYLYWLELVKPSGKSMYGPVSINTKFIYQMPMIRR